MTNSSFGVSTQRSAAVWLFATLGWLLVACDATSSGSARTSEPEVPSVIGQIDDPVATQVVSTDAVEATDAPLASDVIDPSVTDPGSEVVPPELVPFWFFDFGVLGVGDRPFYNLVTLGNSGDPPIRLIEIVFPEMPEGLAVRRVALEPENEPELGWPNDPFPAGASPVAGFVLGPTNGNVENVFEDDRFVSVYVEVEVVGEGQWMIGPMDVTYVVDGVQHTRRVAENVGSACTTPRDIPCIPHLQQ